MKVNKFTIPIYDYAVVYIELSAKDSIDKQIAVVSDELTKMKTDQKYIDDAVQDIKNERKNGGNHFYNLTRSVSVILIDPHDIPDRIKALLLMRRDTWKIVF